MCFSPFFLFWHRLVCLCVCICFLCTSYVKGIYGSQGVKKAKKEQKKWKGETKRKKGGECKECSQKQMNYPKIHGVCSE